MYLVPVVTHGSKLGSGGFSRSILPDNNESRYYESLVDLCPAVLAMPRPTNQAAALCPQPVPSAVRPSRTG